MRKISVDGENKTRGVLSIITYTGRLRLLSSGNKTCFITMTACLLRVKAKSFCMGCI